MIECRVKGQELELRQPKVVAETVDYLEALFEFEGAEWEGLAKWAHFRNGREAYEVAIVGGLIGRGAHLNLDAGVWLVFVHGDGADGMRVTTEEARLVVERTGFIGGEALPEVPLGVAEQLSAMIGDLGDLDTEERGSVVGAINEVLGRIGSGGGGGGGASGKDGVGIKSVEQTTTSTEDGGVNVVTVTLTDGSKYTFDVRNGSKGSDGKDGVDGKDGEDGKTPQKGVDYFTEADKQELVSAVLSAMPNGDEVAY